MEEARHSFESGFGYYEKRAFSQAFQEWKRTILADRELMPGGGGHYAKQVSEYLGDEYWRRAQRSLRKGDREQARHYCEIALKASPDHRGALELLAQIGSDGENGYRRKG
jgi:hypothetical protein